jgi:integrase/recombinase XerD
MYNPASEIEIPKLPKRLPRMMLSAEQANTIITDVDTSTPEGIRDRAMLETLYSSGVRRKELISLQLHDVDVKRRTLFVREGKNGKDRMLPLGERAAIWMEKYLVEARDTFVRDISERHIFLTIRGEKFHASTLSTWVRRYLAKHGITSGGAHLFRHSMAQGMLENGCDIRFIQSMLGHSQLSTTQVYTQVSIEKLREIHTATHPAKMGEEKDE